ncbi:MAG: nucleotidyltransferase family protein [Pseudomonadales bacterium]
MKTITSSHKLLVKRAAIQPLLSGRGETALELASLFPSVQHSELAKEILAQRLAPMWSNLLYSQQSKAPIKLEEALRDSQAHATANYLLQFHILTEITGLFEKEDIAHAVVKGAHIREIVYQTPSLRIAEDIDILIHLEDRRRAIDVLIDNGYSHFPNPKNLSHETSLVKKNVTIDLHWDIFRPGRSRVPISEALLSSREKYQKHWGLGTTETLYLMLVHPVFTKYSTTPNATLDRIVDLSKWLQLADIDWGRLNELCDITGTKTAAWITLSWFSLLTDNQSFSAFQERLQPGRIRKAWFKNWLIKDYSSRVQSSAILVHAGFTLPAHDKPIDVLRAMTQRLNS